MKKGEQTGGGEFVGTPLTLSVIVPTYRGGELLRASLESLSRQVYPRDAVEIFVVDDGSPEFDASELPSYAEPLKVQVLRLPSNQGRARARNAGTRAAAGKIVVFLDDDMTVEPDFLSAHCRFHLEYAGEVGVGNIRFGAGVAADSLTRYIESRGVHRYARGEAIPFKCFVTGNSSVERDRVLRVGLFDEAFSAYGGEDLELGYRLFLDGATFRFAADAHSLHHRGRSLDEMCDLMYTYGLQSLPLVLDKHPELSALLRLDFVRRRKLAPWTLLARLALTQTLYDPVRALVHGRLQRPVPSILFDYLLWYNRTRGFLASVDEDPACDRNDD